MIRGYLANACNITDACRCSIDLNEPHLIVKKKLFQSVLSDDFGIALKLSVVVMVMPEIGFVFVCNGFLCLSSFYDAERLKWVSIHLTRHPYAKKNDKAQQEKKTRIILSNQLTLKNYQRKLLYTLELIGIEMAVKLDS